MHRFVKVKSTSASAEIFLTDLSPSMKGIICTSGSRSQNVQIIPFAESYPNSCPSTTLTVLYKSVRGML